MPYISYRGVDNGVPQLFVGDEPINGVIGVEVDFSPHSHATVKITAILDQNRDGFDIKEIKTEPGKFAFKEGISNDSIQ